MSTQRLSQAYWLTATELAWNPSRHSSVTVPLDGQTQFFLNVRAGKRIRLEDGLATVGDRPSLAAKFPYLSNFRILSNASLEKEVSTLIKEELVLTVERPDGKVLYSTGLQLFPVIDEFAYYDGDDLGVRIDRQGRPVFKLWAPTARKVRLLVFETSSDRKPSHMIDMRAGDSGIWGHDGLKSWIGMFYLYEVEVYVPRLGQVEKNLVTDPYSFSLSMNSKKSQIIDMDDPALKPRGWDDIKKRGPAHPTDISIYELHVRDFSSADLTVSNELRGKYLAFTEKNSLGMAHLRRLASAGMTHVHLLPIYDFATVIDNDAERVDPEIPFGLGPDSPIPQTVLARVKGKDGYNWGYDPFHYFAPEGSYSTAPDGAKRILELRELVRGLADINLRVIMDVVFNHTFASGQDEKSVLDRVVPSYYYRLNADGAVETSACGGCGDTATEHAMMGKLMKDAVVFWARQYKIDGFRFDLMGHHTKASILAVRKALDALTLEKDGVDGKRIYMYGEGWKFGSLDAIMSDRACTQWNMFGTGVGTFNDRLRDKVRGGNFSHDTRTEQGFATGLYYDDNGLQGIKSEDQKNRLLQFMDVIRVGMAGNLRGFQFRSWLGEIIHGDRVDSNGSPAGYAAAPEETINYVSAHDNYELWDQIAAKAPFMKGDRSPVTATAEERARMQQLALSLVAFSQGVPFFTAGSDFLRSKSGDGDSYDSGDWFNRIDWGLHSNNWGVGLPPEEKNGGQWDFWAPRLRDWTLAATPDLMQKTAEHFQAALKIRASSRLFRLHTLEEIQKRVWFLSSEYGMGQPPGFIVMLLRDDFEEDVLDPERRSILCAFNATRESVRFAHDWLKARNLVMHREWKDSFEPRIREASLSRHNGELIIPARTVLVYEELRR